MRGVGFGRRPFATGRGDSGFLAFPGLICLCYDDDLPFKIERWSEGYERPEKAIALAADLRSAKGAFAAAVKHRRGELIMHRHKARVILKSDS